MSETPLTRADIERLFHTIDGLSSKMDRISDDLSQIKSDSRLSEHRLNTVEKKVENMGKSNILGDIISTVIRTVVQSIIVGAIAALWLGIKQKLTGG